MIEGAEGRLPLKEAVPYRGTAVNGKGKGASMAGREARGGNRYAVTTKGFNGFLTVPNG